MTPTEGRTISTVVMWIASMAGVVLLSDKLSESSAFTVIIVGVLMVLIVLGAIGGTLAIWTSAKDIAREEVVQAAEKTKRDNREHEERVKRLVEMLDEDEIAYLESRARQVSVGDDGELYEPNRGRR